MIRVYHPWWDWECYKAGFYETLPPDGMDTDEALYTYKTFLSDLNRFETAIKKVFKKWPNSCEHFLSNPSMNRIAWIGQSSLCIETGISSAFKGGYQLLSSREQEEADKLAKTYLDKWIKKQCQIQGRK